MRYNTGNPVGPDGSSSPFDLHDNSGVFDQLLSAPLEKYPNRLGLELKSWQGMMKQVTDYLNAHGYEAETVIYEAGAVVLRQTQLVERSGELYKVTLSSDLPLTLSGDWGSDVTKLTAVGDAALRSELADENSSVVVSGHPAAVYQRIADNVSIDVDGRARTSKLALGTESIVSPTNRDAMVVASIVEGLSDCHGVTVKTILQNITDYGGWSSFDAVATVLGAHEQDHAASYQARTTYGGSNLIKHIWGLLVAHNHSGSGVVKSNVGVEIQDIFVSGGGAVEENLGLYIRDLTQGTSKAAISLGQSTGFAIAATGGAPIWSTGALALGTSPNTNSQLLSLKATVAGPTAFMSTTVSSGQLGVLGDAPVQFVTGGTVALELGDISAQQALRPGSDNAQPLGDATKRWSSAWVGSGVLSTSDARHKTEVRAFTDTEISAAREIAQGIGFYKFKDAIAAKGDEAREHAGMTVQWVIEVFERHGLDPFKYSFICYDKWDRIVVEHPAETVEHPDKFEPMPIVDANGQQILKKVADAWTEVVKEPWTEVVQEAGDLYSFREGGLQWFVMMGMLADIKERDL